jgi:CRP-like cAMP-binding protein
MSSNRILTRLSRTDLRLLEPHLQAVDLPVRKPLVARNKRIEHVYFPESGVVSVVANGKHSIEVGIIGREGMTGVSLVLSNNDKSPYETYVQIAGDGQSIPANNLLAAIEASGTLLKELLKYANSFLIQTTQTALANGRHKIEERLARWLLMAHDRLDGDEVPLTHEFLGVMIGTSRPGVTIALQELERRGWLTQRRGIVSIIDRDGLVRASNGAYVAPNDK